MLNRMRIAIIGYGREGKSLFRFIRRSPQFRGAELWVLDKDPRVKVPRGVRRMLGKNYLARLERFDLVFRSPGIPYVTPELVRARKRGVHFSSPTKLFFEEAARRGAKIIGVTGTKGKGTTSTLIYSILKHAGKKAFLAGNIGTPALDIVSKLDRRSWVVLELSSFQLIDLGEHVRKPSFVATRRELRAKNLKRDEGVPQGTSRSDEGFVAEDSGTLAEYGASGHALSPHIAVVLMVTSEHMDWHANLKEYVAAKENIVRFQSPRDYAIIAEEYPRSRAFARLTPAKIFSYSKQRKVKRGAWVEDGAFWFSNGVKRGKICATSDLWIPGFHNLDNTCAAITAAKIAGVKNNAIKNAIREFRGLEHRLELVRVLHVPRRQTQNTTQINADKHSTNIRVNPRLDPRESASIRFYDDSYSTTPETGIVAVAAFDAPKILILGGSKKGSDFRKLGAAISRSKSVKAIIGIGVEWPRIKRFVHNPRITIVEGCRNMREIVRAARNLAAPGDVVLLSPACASFDMFKNYGDRGRQFKKFVRQLRQ